MNINDLQIKLGEKKARLAVIGLGYVGLPVAALLAESGFDVLGVEIRSERVEKINHGICPIEGVEPGLADLLEKVIAANKLRATADYSDLKDRDVILIDVETPVDEKNTPRYEALRAVLKSLGPVMKAGALVIVESTIAPRTMKDVVLPLLEQSSGSKVNTDFYLGHCPERVMPGKLLKNLSTLSRVCGGMTPETAKTMIALYCHIVHADLDPADCITAELVKTVENAYRDVQIAFANEVALICDSIGADVWRVRELVNKSPYRQMHLPGAGVGGHCIPKDPWLLAYSVRDNSVPLRIVLAARAVNNYMPLYIVDLVRKGLLSFGRQFEDAKVLVMGYAYLENSDDARNSPSIALVKHLQELGTKVVIHDPYVSEYKGDLPALAIKADAVVVMVAHSTYKTVILSDICAVMRTPLLIDGRSVYTKAQAEKAGFKYIGLGKGINHQEENHA
jgi:UDP-N-acetyl-D-mannosaminuronic acid dehydrogenase